VRSVDTAAPYGKRQLRKKGIYRQGVWRCNDERHWTFLPLHQTAPRV